MLEIKTIFTKVDDCKKFDKQVNAALAEGWELVRRDIIPPRVPDRYTLLYAELDRIIEEPEEEPVIDNVGVWLISRDPHFPYKCSGCGCKIQDPLVNCPHCHRLMEVEE